MKAILLTISFIITLSLSLSGFILIGESNPKHKLIYPSPLDMTKIKSADNNTLDKDADLQNSEWYSQAMENIEKEE